MKFGYLLAKVKSKIMNKNKYEIMNDYYRKGGARIGENCAICSNLDLCDSFCLNIGNNVIISSDVLFVTHDASASRVIKGSPSFWGEIVIGNNCFIGERSTLLYGVNLADNIIVAAGAVVTHSFDTERVIIGGNPAKIIGTWDAMSKKYAGKGMDASLVPSAIRNHDNRLITRKISK